MSTLVPTQDDPGGVVLSSTGIGYANASRSTRTWEAYASDMRAYEKFGGVLPATVQSTCDWMVHMADEGCTAATIQRRLSSLSMVHRNKGWDNPTRSEAVRELHRGIRRSIGTAPTKKAAIMSSDLAAYFAELNGELRALRDKTMLVWGLATACRRTELVALNVEDLTPIDEGYRVLIRRSKTDPTGDGAHVAVVYGSNPITDPIRLMRSWLERSGITTGPIFRGIDNAGRISDTALSPRMVGLVVKKAAAALGKDPSDFGGHSLRRGFITEAAKAGASEREIAKQSRHKSYTVLRGYIQETQIADRDNAVHRLGL